MQEGMLGEEGPLAGTSQSPPQLGTKRGFLEPLGAKEGVEGGGVRMLGTGRFSHAFCTVGAAGSCSGDR